MELRRNSLPGPDDIIRRVLPNGIVVLIRPNPHTRSVVVAGSLEAGSLYDPPDLDGMAAFTASMLLRGTRTRDFATIHELLESNGAGLSFSSGRHTIGFSGKSLGEDLLLLVDLMADALRYPVFPTEHVERLRGQVVTAIRVREQDTRYMAGRALRGLVYPDHPYRRDTGGRIETVSQIARDQLIAHHEQHLGPAGMLLVITGAVDVETAFSLLEDHLGDWDNPQQPAPLELPDLAPLEATRTETVPMPGKSQSDIVLGVPGPPRFADDWYAADLANNILGVFGMYGRIGAEVREKHGMAYYSYSHLEGGLGPGAWRVVAGVNPANVERAIDAVRDEIRRIITEPVSAEELVDSKANFIGRLPLELEKNEGVAAWVLQIERYGLGLDCLRNYADTINAVTVEDVQAAAQRYLSPDVYALAVAGPDAGG